MSVFGGGITGVSLGPGTFMVDEKLLYEQFAPFGSTMHGFRVFRRSIGVPAIHMPDGTALVDLLSFQLALRALNSLGRPDSRFPGRTGWINKETTVRTTEIDKAWLRDNLKTFISELLYARKLDYVRNTQQTREAMTRATDRIALALAQAIDEELLSAKRRIIETPESGDVTQPAELTPVPSRKRHAPS